MLGDAIGGGIKKGGSSDPYLGSDFNTILGVGAGSSALAHSTGAEGYYNTFMGYQAGYRVTTGAYNVLIGHLAGTNQSTVDSNTAIGTYALYANVTGTRQVAVGYQALYLNTAGYNVAIGFRAGRNNTGAENVFIGVDAGYSSGAANYLMYLGYRAGYNTTSGLSNVAIGRKALESNTTGSNNVAIGKDAGGSADVSGCVYLGAAAGQNNTSASKLFIDVTNTATPLLHGDFASRYLVINNELRIAGDVGGQASHNSFTGATDTPTSDPGWATSSTTNMSAPDGYIKAYVGTQAVVLPYWNT